MRVILLYFMNTYIFFDFYMNPDYYFFYIRSSNR